MSIGYWAKTIQSLVRHLQEPAFRRQLVTAGVAKDEARRAQETWFLDAYPDADSISVPVGNVTWRRSNMDPMERYILGALAILHGAKSVFEIGTYDGSTTLALARMVPDAAIWTLDLSPSEAAVGMVPAEVASVKTDQVGVRFRSEPEARRIRQLLGDSRTFDFRPYFGQCDLVLIDGAHDYESVRSDTKNAMNLLREGGVVVWDDYVTGWPGVVRAVNDVIDDGMAVLRPAGTDLAVWDQSRQVSEMS